MIDIEFIKPHYHFAGKWQEVLLLPEENNEMRHFEFILLPSYDLHIWYRRCHDEISEWYPRGNWLAAGHIMYHPWKNMYPKNCSVAIHSGASMEDSNLVTKWFQTEWLK